MPELRWYERLNALNITLLVFLLLVVFSLPALRGSDREMDYLSNLARFAGYFFPPDFSVAGAALRALGETIQIAVMATFFAVLLAIPVAGAAAQNISPRWLVVVARMALNVVRTIPALIWALIAVAVVGANPLAGVIGLTFYALGYLGKFFADAFESMDDSVTRGLKAIGAGRVQAFQHGLWPHARPLIWSHALWMLEYNIRAATIIGYVGAGGVGVMLHTFVEYYAWDRFATVLLFILALVTALDFLGEWARGKITGRAERPAA
jgi:phosphonate transport system permease protein